MITFLFILPIVSYDIVFNLQTQFMLDQLADLQQKVIIKFYKFPIINKWNNYAREIYLFKIYDEF